MTIFVLVPGARHAVARNRRACKTDPDSPPLQPFHVVHVEIAIWTRHNAEAARTLKPRPVLARCGRLRTSEYLSLPSPRRSAVRRAGEPDRNVRTVLS